MVKLERKLCGGYYLIQRGHYQWNDWCHVTFTWFSIWNDLLNLFSLIFSLKKLFKKGVGLQVRQVGPTQPKSKSKKKKKRKGLVWVKLFLLRKKKIIRIKFFFFFLDRILELSCVNRFGSNFTRTTIKWTL